MQRLATLLQGKFVAWSYAPVQADANKFSNEQAKREFISNAIAEMHQYNPQKHGPDQTKFELCKALNPFTDRPDIAMPERILGWN